LAKLSYHHHFQVPLHHKKAKKKNKLCHVWPIYNQIWPNYLLPNSSPLFTQGFFGAKFRQK
jgi:hypothetical protein